MKKKIFIAEGAGFIGYFIVKELLQEGHFVLIYDNFSIIFFGLLADQISFKRK